MFLGAMILGMCAPVLDEATFEALDRRIGQECRGRAVPRRFDTNAARAVTQQVLREVRGARRRTSSAP